LLPPHHRSTRDDDDQHCTECHRSDALQTRGARLGSSNFGEAGLLARQRFLALVAFGLIAYAAGGEIAEAIVSEAAPEMSRATSPSAVARRSPRWSSQASLRSLRCHSAAARSTPSTSIKSAISESS
jgi:hypothetical protein